MPAYCYNEAANQNGRWGAAQYRTRFSASFINYEGMTYTKEGVLYYISGSYEPSTFSWNSLSHLSIEEFSFLPQMPIDLILFFEFAQFENLIFYTQLVNNILDEEDWGFWADILVNMCYQDEITYYFKQIYERGDEPRKNMVLKVGELYGNTDLLALSDH